MPNLPAAQGLYDPAYEHDACGVAFVVDLQGRRSHDLVAKGVAALCHLEHRGASGAEENSGDGAGILLQVPDAFLREVAGFDLPPAGAYATGIAFLPPDPATADEAVASIDKIAASEGLRVLGWRDVPVDPSSLGSMARDAMPSFRQLFLAGPEADTASPLQGMALERRAFVVRKRIEHEIVTDAGTPAVYFPSLSARTLVYKGMLTTPAARALLPRPRRRARRVGPGAGAQPLLHQHLPVVGAGPPLPPARPQRRDQHRHGQPQLDAGPRGAAGLGGLRRPRPERRRQRHHRPHLPDLHAGRVRLGHLRRGARAARAGRAPPAPRGAR